MQTSTLAALAAFGGALVALALYHFAVAVPAMRRVSRVVATHDELLDNQPGGAAQGARARLSSLEEAAAARKADAQKSEQQVQELQKQAQLDISRVGFHRFNAFSDTGSELSYAVALLNRRGDGVVLSSIFSREDTRTFGKAVAAFEPLQDASKEELRAIALARGEQGQS